MLENFGLRVISERPYELAWPEGGAAWIQDFELEHRDRLVIEIARIEANFRDAFARRLERRDRERRLQPPAARGRSQRRGRSWCCAPTAATCCRPACPSARPTWSARSRPTPAIARNLVRLFETRFDPGARSASAGNARRAHRREHRQPDPRRSRRGREPRRRPHPARLPDAGAGDAAHQLLPARRATAQPKSYLSFKFDPAKIPDLPLPRPKFEIFVYSPRVEGVHLRMGDVARGGIRWSDRREDFRTEVLGLMKAQNVKNTRHRAGRRQGRLRAKRLPASGTREEIQAEVVACYQTFIRGLLDLTDNIVSGRIVPPPQVVRQRRRRSLPRGRRRQGHRDLLRHRQRHLRRLRLLARRRVRLRRLGRLRPQEDGHHGARRLGVRQAPLPRDGRRHAEAPHFTVVGIGDMSGDVFGNGMLLSRHIRLQAAFDHRHIFLDPDPHPRRELRRARAAVRAAALELGRLRPQEALARRRRLPAHRQVDRAVRRKRAPCSASRARPRHPTRSSARSCACRSTCCGTAASAPT